MNECWVQLTQVVTQILNTLLAVGTLVIALIMAHLAWKNYLKEPVQEQQPSLPKDENAEQGPLSRIVVFDTKKQKTTIQVTERGLECDLEDKQQGQVNHQWTITKRDATEILSNKGFTVNPGYKANTGVFSIGPRVNWFYSKKLYPIPVYLEEDLRAILKTASA